MTVEQTLSIIKPDGVQKNLIGEIYSRFEKAGLEVIGARMMHLTSEQAQGFYDVHKERPFFDDLVAYMTSGPVIVQVLSGDNAVAQNRDIMGATNPADAAAGSIRADFATMPAPLKTALWFASRSRACEWSCRRRLTASGSANSESGPGAART